MKTAARVPGRRARDGSSADRFKVLPHLVLFTLNEGKLVVILSPAQGRFKHFLPVRPDADRLSIGQSLSIIGLSLGNEGIKKDSKVEADRIFEQYRTGIEALINRCPANGVVPIVALCYTRGETLFFVDGELAGSVQERLEPTPFVLGGSGRAGAGKGPNRLDVKEWLVYRSALNAREAAALHESKLLQASLEIHAPLDDGVFAPGEPVQNRAQSVSEARVGAGSATHGEE